MAAPPTLPAVVPSKATETAASGGRGIAYGAGNTIPAVCLDAALDSGTTYRCLERRAQFLEGSGFGPAGDFDVPGQPGKTANDLWSEWCSYAAYNNGAAALVRYNRAGQMAERYVLPFHSIRKTDKGTFLLNHKYGRKGFSAKGTTEHSPFDNSKEVVQQVVAWADTPVDPRNPDGPKHGQPGQILYVYKPKAGEEDYPLPPHWPGLEDTLADAEYARFDYEEVRNGFFASAMLTLIGEQDNATEGEDGKTEQDRTDDELRSFTGNTNQPGGRKKLFVMEAKTKEEAPILTPFNGNTNVEKLIAKRESIGEIVCRNIGIPPILAGFAKPGQLGAAQEILNAVELTQESLEPLRKLLVRQFWRLMPELDGQQPGVKKPISFLPQAVLDELTPDEKRALGGYKPNPATPTVQP